MFSSPVGIGLSPHVIGIGLKASLISHILCLLSLALKTIFLIFFAKAYEDIHKVFDSATLIYVGGWHFVNCSKGLGLMNTLLRYDDVALETIGIK